MTTRVHAFVEKKLLHTNVWPTVYEKGTKMAIKGTKAKFMFLSFGTFSVTSIFCSGLGSMA